MDTHDLFNEIVAIVYRMYQPMFAYVQEYQALSEIYHKIRVQIAYEIRMRRDVSNPAVDGLDPEEIYLAVTRLIGNPPPRVSQSPAEADHTDPILQSASRWQPSSSSLLPAMAPTNVEPSLERDTTTFDPTVTGLNPRWEQHQAELGWDADNFNCLSGHDSNGFGTSEAPPFDYLSGFDSTGFGTSEAPPASGFIHSHDSHGPLSGWNDNYSSGPGAAIATDVNYGQSSQGWVPETTNMVTTTAANNYDQSSYGWVPSSSGPAPATTVASTYGQSLNSWVPDLPNWATTTTTPNVYDQSLDVSMPDLSNLATTNDPVNGFDQPLQQWMPQSSNLVSAASWDDEADRFLLDSSTMAGIDTPTQDRRPTPRQRTRGAPVQVESQVGTQTNPIEIEEEDEGEEEARVMTEPRLEMVGETTPATLMERARRASMAHNTPLACPFADCHWKVACARGPAAMNFLRKHLENGHRLVQYHCRVASCAYSSSSKTESKRHEEKVHGLVEPSASRPRAGPSTRSVTRAQRRS